VELLEAFWKQAHQQSKAGLQGYLDNLIIDSRPPARLKKLLTKNPWEGELLQLLIPLFEAASGFGDAEKRCAYITAPRGHSKTSILAMLCNWALVYSKHPISIVAAAADRDQAQILISRCKAEAKGNPWLKDQLHFKHYEVLGPQGVLTACASDAPSSSGMLCDLHICDELTWHAKRDLFDILYSGKDKRRQGCFIIISNAGEKGTWQHDLWESSKKSPCWVCHEVPPMSASWLDEALIEEQRATLPLSLFRRLHLNIWTTPGEDNAFVSRDQLAPCMTGHESQGDRDNAHVISIDYGMTRDRTALCVCHADDNGMVVLDTMSCWQGTKDAHVQIDKIEDWIREQMQTFRVSKIILDAFQLESTAQKFEPYVDVERVNFGSNMLMKLAENLRSLILSQRIKLYPGAGPVPVKSRMEDLADELLDLQIVEKGSVWNWEHSMTGHDDRTVVLAMAALTIVKERPRLPEIVILSNLEGNSDLEGDEEEMVWHETGLKLSCWN
jgi:hypothetical protein